MCAARLGSDGLACIREDAHEEHRGCVFVSSSVADGHTASEDAAERGRS